MKIILIVPRFHTNLYYSMLALQNFGYKIKVLVLYKGNSEYYKDIDIQLINIAMLYKIFFSILSYFKRSYLKSNLELKLLYADKSLKSEIINYKPDIILLKAYLDLLSTQVLKIAKKNNINVILLLQTKKNRIKKSRFLFYRYISFLKKHRVIAFITPILINKIKFEEASIKNIFYIPFIFENNNFKKKYFKNNKINIISVGKFIKRKDQMLLLKVINDLKNDYKIHITFIGEASDKEYLKIIKDYIKENKLEDIVDILNNLSYDEILKKYRNYDLFVLSSYNEPAAYSIVEAMANKLPVICSDECWTKCYINEGENGFIFKAKDKENLLNFIIKIIKNKNDIIKMGNKSHKLSKINHSQKNFIKKFNYIINGYNHL